MATMSKQEAAVTGKSIYKARAEARRLSVRYGVWYVVRTASGEYQSYAFVPDRLDNAPELVATYINGKLAKGAGE